MPRTKSPERFCNKGMYKHKFESMRAIELLLTFPTAKTHILKERFPVTNKQTKKTKEEQKYWALNK